MSLLQLLRITFDTHTVTPFLAHLLPALPAAAAAYSFLHRSVLHIHNCCQAGQNVVSIAVKL
jgi:hypothetical protein